MSDHVSASTTSVSLTGLAANTATTFSIVAVNAVGSSASAVTNVIVPTGVGASCSLYWTGAVSSSWDVAGNWSATDNGSSAGRTPTSTDVLCFSSAPTTSDVVLSSSATVQGIQWPAAGAVTPHLTIAWNGSLSVTNDPASAVATLDQNGSLTLGLQTALRTSTWTTGGTPVVSGPGSLILSTSGVANLGGQWPTLNNGATLINQGTVNLPVGSTFYLGGHSVIDNLAVFNMGNDTDICDLDRTGNYFDNGFGATVNGNATTDTAEMHVAYSNQGTTNINGGSFVLHYGTATNIPDAGPWNVATDAKLVIDAGRSFSSSTLVSGHGTLVVNAPVSAGPNSVTSSLDVEAPLTLTGSASLNVYSLTLDSSVTGGSLTDSESLTIPAGGSASLVGTIVTNAATASGSIDASARLNVTSHGALDNAGSLSLDNASVIMSTDGTGSFANTGTTSVLSGTASVNVSTTNSGTLSVGYNTLNLNSSVTETSSAIVLASISNAGYGTLNTSYGAVLAGKVIVTVDPALSFRGTSVSYRIVTGTSANNTTVASTPGVVSASTVNANGTTVTLYNAPTITSTNTASFLVGTSGSFQVTAEGFGTLSYTVTGTLPNGVSLDPTTGLLSGTPTQSGSFPITINVSNGKGAATQSFTLVVYRAPTITSSTSTTFVNGTAGSFTVTSTGYLAASLSETGTLPAGVTFTNNHNGTATIAGTPTQSGAFNLTLTATNASGTYSQSFVLYVNQAPAITSVNHDMVVIGQANTFTVTSTGYPNAALTVTGTLPTGVTFVDNGDGTATLSGTPASGTQGTYSVTISATNAAGTTTQRFTLNVNQAPAFTSANSTLFSVSQANTFTVTTTGYPAPTYTESGTLPTGVSFNNTTGVLSGTPAAGTNGVYVITITATNAAASVSQTFTLDVVPCITSANTTVFPVGSADSFTVTSAGISSPTYSETGTLPSGVTLSSSGVLSGTPTQSGTYVITLRATNGVLTATQTFTLIVSATPVITSTSSTTYTTGTAGTFTVTATGYPTPTLSESGALPSGVTFNATTGVLSGTPAAGTGGSYTLTFTATNTYGTTTQTFTLIVNQAPAITSAATTTFTTGIAGSFTVTTTGYPASTLTVTGSLPSGVGFLNNGDGTATFSGTPAAGTGGSYTVTIHASNGVGSTATQTFTLVVFQAPVITSVSSTTFQTGQSRSFTVTATGYTAPTFSESGSLPSGVTLNATTGVLSGTPVAGTGGVYTITITATDPAGSTQQSFTLTVNQAPVITSAASKTFTVGTSTTFNVTTTGWPLPTLAESGTLPSGVTFVDNDNGTASLAGNPTAGSGGIYTLTITATNTFGTATQAFTLTVNQAPTYLSAATTTFTAGQASSFTVSTQDYPTTTTYSCSGTLPNGIIFTDLGNGTATFSGTPTLHSGGSYTVTLSATNSVGTTHQTFVLIVNQAPVITSATSATFTVSKAGTFSVTSTGYTAATYSESGTLPSGVTFTTGGVLAGTPAASAGGAYPITISATNPLGTSTQSFTLYVLQGPAFTSASSTTLTVGTAANFTVTTSGYPGATYTYTGTLPSGVILVDNGNGTASFSGTPRVGASGVYTITLHATNSTSSATQTFTLTVNRAPVFTSAASTTFTVGTAGTFTVTDTGYPAISTITKTSGTLPTGVTFNSSTGVLSGTPAAGTGGTYTLVFSITNTVGTTTQTFTLTVDQGPAFTNVTSTIFTVGTSGSFNFTTTGVPSPSLSESGALPDGVSFVDNGNGTATLSGTPTVGAGGTYTLTITATNSVASATQTFTLNVHEAPTVTSVATTTFTVGTAGSFTVTATGTGTLTYAIVGNLPSGVTFNSSTGVLSGTPAAGTGGVYTVTINVTNTYGTGSQTFTLNVNQGPAFTSASSTTFTIGSAGSFTVTTNGVPNATYTYTGTLPSGVVLVDNGDGTGTLSGTPAAGFSGVYALTITASNIVSSVSQTFTLTVDQAPAFTSGSSTTFASGSAGSFTVSASGYPAPTFTESGTLPSGVTFNSTTGVFSGTPAAGTSGAYTVTLTATSGSLVTHQTFTLYVTQAISFSSSATATFTVGTAGSFTVTTAGYPKGSLWETGALPSGLTFTDNGNGTATLSGTPAAGTGGTYVFTWTALLNGVTTTQTFTLTINETVSFTSATTTSFVVGAGSSFWFTTAGFPGATYSETGSLPSGVTLSSNGSLSGTPAAGTDGTYTITVTATNGLTSTSETFILVVTTTTTTVTTTVTETFTYNVYSSWTITQGSGHGSLTESGRLPGGVTWTDNGNGTATLSGTTTTSGSYTITVTYTYQTTVQTETFTIYVVQGPSYTSATSGTFTVGTYSTFQMTAAGFPTPTFSYTGTLPLGLNFNTSTGTIYGTPAPGTGGSYSWTLTITNSVTTITQSFTLIVDQTPTLTSSSSTFTVGSAGSVTLHATGYPTSTFSETGALPSGVTFNASTGTFSGTPAAGTGGSYSVTITITDAVTTVTVTYTIVVRESISFTSSSSATFVVGTYASDTVTLGGNPAGTIRETSTLPSGITFVDNGNGTGTFFGKPGYGAGGTYTVTLTATSSLNTVTQTFTLTVNAAPWFTPSQLLSASFVGGSAGSVTFAAEGYSAPTYTETGNLPSGVTLNATTGVLSGTPAAGTGGVYTITITATNAVGSESITFTLTVTQAPTFTSGSTLTYTAGTYGTFTVNVTGAPTPVITYTGTLPNGVSLIDNRNGTATIAGTPGANAGGTYTVTLHATNTSGSATETLTITVDSSPLITTSTTTATYTVGTASSTSFSATGLPTATFSETGALPSGVTFVDNHNGTATLSGTAVAGTGGVYTFTITVSNTFGSSSETFTLNVNQTPSVTSSATVSATVGTLLDFVTTATALPNATWSLTSGTLPSGVTFVDDGNGQGELFGTPASGSGGTYTLSLKATNTLGSATQTLVLTVKQAPVLTSAGTTTFTVGTAGTFSVTTTGYSTPSLSETGTLPSGVTFVDNGNGTASLAGTPAAGTGGSYSFTITATNSLGTTTQTFTLIVKQSAAFTSANTTTFNVTQAGNYTISTTGFPTPYFTVTGNLPTGVTFVDNGNGTGTLEGTPIAGTGNTYTLTINAINTLGTVSQTFTFVVDQPLVYTGGTSTLFVVGTAGSVSLSSTGYPAATWTEMGNLPSGLTLSTAGVLSGTPAAGTGGVYTFVATGTNGFATLTVHYTITVNQVPAITSANSATFTVGTAGSYTVTATGYPTPTFSETGSLPTGVTFNASTGVLSGTPAAGTGGSYAITLKATGASSTTLAFTLLVNQNLAITSSATTSFTVGTSGAYTVTATGFPAPTYSLSGTLPTGLSFNTATGVLSGTPNGASAGTYPVTITASNGVSTATLSLTISIYLAPTFTSTAATTFTVGRAGTFSVTTSGSPTASLSLTGTLPSGVTFNASTGVLSGTPAAGTGGSYTVVLTATNLGGTTTQSFTLTVNQLPTFVSASSFNFVTGTSNTFTVGTTAIPNATLTETGTLPAGITFVNNGNGTATLSGTPTVSEDGVYTLTFTATNIAGTTTQTFTLSIVTPPQITSSNFEEFTVGTSVSFTVTTSGYPNATLSITAGLLPTGLTFHDNGNGTATISGTPAAGTDGEVSVTVTATNVAGSYSQLLTIGIDG